MGTIVFMAKNFNRWFGKRLRAMRISAGYESAREFAAMIGVAENTLTRWERGETQPNLQTLLRICQILQTTPNEILVGRVPTDPPPADKKIPKQSKG